MSDVPTWTERFAAHLPATERERALVAALSFGASGGLVALCIAGGWVALTSPYRLAAPAPDPELLGVALWLVLSAGLGAAAVGGPLWWLLVERDDEPARVRGAAVGAAAGLLAHPLMWILFGTGVGLAIVVDRGAVAVGTVRPDDVGALLGGFALVTVVGVMLTGVVTIPVGAGTGVLLARVRRALPDRLEQGPRHL